MPRWSDYNLPSPGWHNTDFYLRWWNSEKTHVMQARPIDSSSQGINGPLVQIDLLLIYLLFNPLLNGLEKYSLLGKKSSYVLCSLCWHLTGIKYVTLLWIQCNNYWYQHTFVFIKKCGWVQNTFLELQINKRKPLIIYFHKKNSDLSKTSTLATILVDNNNNINSILLANVFSTRTNWSKN